ncbi:transglycosylase domain-containing protein [Chitinophagaceae bacterium MMS25-I14]
MKRSVRILWRVFIISVIAFNLLILLINMGWLGYMPSKDAYENPSSALSSEVYAADGTLLGRYFVQDRSNSTYSEISPNVINALVATEDERFYDHSGIDPIATAAIPFYIIRGSKRGSSTITQQLAKNLFGRQHANIFTLPIIKLKEWVMAVKLERNLTKNEIITLYLNTVPFPDNVYGIKNASLTFFNKTPDELTVDEAAVLVATLKGNTVYNPRTHPDRAKERRNTVLALMAQNGKITQAQASELQQKPVTLDYHKIDYHEGIAPYFRQVVEQDVKKILKDIKKPGSDEPYDLYKDGLKIYTTIDMRMQRYAEQAVEEHFTSLQKQFSAQSGYKDGSVWVKNKDAVKALGKLIKGCDRYSDLKEEGKSEEEIMQILNRPVKMKVFAWTRNHMRDTVMSPIDSIKYMRMFLQAGFMAMDPFTGEVKAWVGGINHDYFQYDHVNINTKRQVGSTIKPLLYCLAVNSGFSPCGTVSTAPQLFDGYKTPYDAGGSGGNVSMSKALAKSINNAALFLLKQVGINAFVDFVHKCGISSNIDKVPASALGVGDVSLYEMLGAYTMFPSGGINTQPLYITKIEDKNGNLVKNFVPVQKEVINPQTAFKMVKMMRGVIDFGTGHRMRSQYGLTSDIAGKTGTTNRQADAWFIGYTPQLLCGAWVGCDDRFLSFHSEALGQGAAAALPIWAFFMKHVYNDKTLDIKQDMRFKEPDNFDDCNVTDPTSLDRAGLNDANVPSDSSDNEQAPIVPAADDYGQQTDNGGQ